LRRDFLDAVAIGSLGLRSTDRGSLELRLGREVYFPGTGSTEEMDYEPFSVGAGMELIVSLSGLERYCLARQLADHNPCDEAARRVSASGWLRHLSMGLQGQKFEEVLGLPYPESIETASQVLDRVLSCASASRLACLAAWTDRGLDEWWAGRSECGDLTLGFEPSTLESGFPESLRRDAPLKVRLDEFRSRWPGHVRLVEDVPFAFGKSSQRRSVLVLAMNGLTDVEFESFRQDYLNSIGSDTISFPCRLRAEHLRTRVGALALALSPEGVRVDFYAPPWRRRRMEAVIELRPNEMDRLRRYIGAVVDDTLGMLGPITLGTGCRTSVGSLDDNRPKATPYKHNCTTWITLAPVCEDGRDLATLVEMPPSWTSHDNPGWWSMFLTGASRSPRVHTVVYWSDLPLEEEPCASGEMISWDFNPH